MTTATFTTVVDQSSDAGFRTWVAEMITQMAGVGLVQTSDTGQINTSTVTRAAANTHAAGCSTIWHFSDSSLYFKLEFGSAPAATEPQMWVTVGTGSNGTGTITGQTSTRNTICNGGAPVSTSTTYVSYICATTNAFALAWKTNGISNLYPIAYLCVGKTVDGTGAATTTGFGVLRVTGTGTPLSFQSVRIAATAATYTDTGLAAPCMVIPGNPSSSTTAGGNFQAYDLFMNVPDVVPFVWAGAVDPHRSSQRGNLLRRGGRVRHPYLFFCREPKRNGDVVELHDYHLRCHDALGMMQWRLSNRRSRQDRRPVDRAGTRRVVFLDEPRPSHQSQANGRCVPGRPDPYGHQLAAGGGLPHRVIVISGTPFVIADIDENWQKISPMVVGVDPGDNAGDDLRRECREGRALCLTSDDGVMVIHLQPDRYGSGDLELFVRMAVSNGEPGAIQRNDAHLDTSQGSWGLNGWCFAHSGRGCTESSPRTGMYGTPNSRET